MVHAPELLGYEQYTPFPAACQWQSERPPPVAGAFAGLFMALGRAACADKSGRTGRLPRALAREPAPFVAANSTYSLRLRQSPSEGRPALAGRSTSLPWGHRPHFGGRARQKPANVARLIFQFASHLLAWRLLSFTGPTQVCGLRKEDRPWRAAQRVCLGAIGPILAKGHAKTGKRRPPHFSVCLSPFGLAPTVIYRAHPSLWTSAGKTRWWGSRCGGRAHRGCRWRPRTPSRARRSRRRG